MKLLKITLRFLLLSFSLLMASRAFAQVSKIDSLSYLLLFENKDTNRVSLLWQLAEQYQSFKPDTSSQLAQKAMLLARRIKFVEGESHALAVLATSQYLLGDYPKALNNYMLKLKIEEKRNSPRNYASALNNIGITYILLEEYPKALEYLYRADSTVDAVKGKAKEELKYNIEVNIGEAFYRMKISDSASVHFNKALILAKLKGDSAALGAAILGEANVLSLNNETEKALSLYKEAYRYLNQGPDADILCETSLGIAKAYEKLSGFDSALYFGVKSYSLAEKSKFLSRQLDAALFLSGIYNKSSKYDSAFFFLEQAVKLKDMVKGNEKVKAAMILSINEKLRQQEINEQKLREKRERFRQLQLLTIAVCIPMFFLITLLVSRKKVNKRLVTFMGIISLLFLFEFLTLLLHPVIGTIAHHIPIFELLLLVCIAALLAPAHHRLEHILLKKLTKRNNEDNGIRIITKQISLKKKK